MWIIIIILIVVVVAIAIKLGLKINEAKNNAYHRSNEERRHLDEISQLSDTGIPLSLMASGSEKKLFMESFSIRGIKEDILKEYSKKNTDYQLDYGSIKDMYERGERIYEFEAHIGKDISISDAGDKTLVLIKDKQIGFVNAKDTELLRSFKQKYDFDGYLIDAYLGNYMKVVKNPDYDKDCDDPEDRNWVERFDEEKPKAELILRYKR